MEKSELLKAIGEAVKEVVGEANAEISNSVKTVAEKLEGLEKKVDEKVTDIDKRLAESGGELKTLSGQVMTFGGRRNKGIGATPYVREKSLGTHSYSIANLISAMLEKNEDLAPLEVHVSAQLKQFGFPGTGAGRSYLVPIAPTEGYMPAKGNAKIEEFHKLMADCMPFDEDLALTRELMSKHRPDLIGKALDPFDATLGGTLVPYPERGMLIELLRKATVVGQAGAQQIPLPPGGVDYPSETGGTTFTRQAPNQTISDSNIATGNVKLTPKQLAGLIKIPNSLIRFSNPAVEGIVRRSLAADAAIAADLDYLEGTGGSLVPKGIVRYETSSNDTPTRGKVTLHNCGTATDGDTFRVSDPAVMMSLLEQANDKEGPTAWVMYPSLFWNLANKRADAATPGDAAGPFLFPVTRGAMSGAIEKTLLNVPVLTSTQVSIARTKGSGTTLTYALLGNFRRSVIGRLGVIEIAVSTERGFELDQTWIRAVLWDDFALLTPESFVFSDQLLQTV